MGLSKLAIYYLNEYREFFERDPLLPPSKLEKFLYEEDDSLSSIPVKQVLVMYASVTKQGKIVCLYNGESRLRVTLEDEWGTVILFDCNVRDYGDTLPSGKDIIKYIDTFLSLPRRMYENLEIQVVRV
jgi:hypothetical protein